nr:RNA-directed DNA polymerase, eukaryota [Tanacetum cinerariifolium]
MNSVRSKEDHVIGISKSVFVTNFPDYFGSHDLWSLCKRFAFIRFIRVDDLDRLINNLCTLWVGRLHIQANAVRYERSPKSFSSTRPPNVKVPSSTKVNVIPSSNRHFPSLFVAVVNDKQGFPALNSIDPPAFEGFADLQISYLGGSWVRIDLASDKSKNKLLLHKGVLSWFNVLKAATNDFSNATFSKISKQWGDVVDIEESVGSSLARKRICVKTSRADNILETFKVVFKGRIFLARAKELFTWTPCFLEYKEEDYNSVDDSVLGDHNNMADILHGHDGKGGGQESEDEGVSKTIFGDNIKSSPCTNRNKSQSAFVQQSDDPFGLNDLLDKPPISRVNELDPSLSHPPGFTPDPSQQVNCHANEAHSVDFSSEASTHIHSRITAKGGSFLDVLDDMIKSSARDFNCFISSSGLVDVKMEGFSFTWVHPSAKKMSKLDRFLVSDGIILGFPAITAVCLDRHLSDHRPILLSEIYTDFGPTPFCTFHSWFSREGFDAMVEQAWSSFTHNDSNSKNYILKTLGDIDKALDNGSVLDELLVKRMELLNKYHELKQLDKGDENSKFFHRIINKRRSQLAIRGDFVNGDWHTEPSLVKDTFLDHFSNRFKQPSSARFKLSLHFPSRLSSDQVLDLDRNISSDEIRAAVWDCGENKSPGPDGYTSEFSRRYWNVIGPDFCLAILDGPFILNEVLSCCKRKRKQALVFKVDFVKAYDSVRWDFLLDIIHAFGFGSRWCMWIRGDPLAPLLFILVMETLHISVSRAVNEGEWSDSNLDNMLRILNCFYLASGLRINVSKSQVLGIGVPSDIVQQGASRIGCDIMKMPFKYLGVMVGDNMSRLSAWSNSIQKIRAKLSKWKVKTLSIGVLHEMEMLRNNFFIGGDAQGKKITWIAWDKVLSSKNNGGFGVSSFYALNRALLLKWVWRFLSHDGSLWSQIIRAIHVRIGDGLKTRFWLDVWLLDMPLCARFTRIFELENNIASVAVKQGAPLLDASFRRPVRDGVERSQWEDLVSLVGGISLSVSADRWVCDLTGDGEFHVRDICTTLDNLFLPSSVVATRWVKHNRLLFDTSPPRRSVLFEDIVSSSFLWSVNRCNSTFSWESWLKNPYLISL